MTLIALFFILGFFVYNLINLVDYGRFFYLLSTDVRFKGWIEELIFNLKLFPRITVKENRMSSMKCTLEFSNIFNFFG